MSSCFQAGEEAGFVADLRGDVVVGMAAFPVRQDDGARAQRADAAGQGQLVVHAQLEVRVGQAEIFAVRDAQDARGGGGFAAASFLGAARAHLAFGEIEDAGATAEAARFDQRAAAGELDVVRMRGDGQQVELHHASVVGETGGIVGRAEAGVKGWLKSVVEATE